MAKEAALKALAIDETVADGHFALALVLDYDEWNWPEAEQEYRRALALHAGDTFARVFYADLLAREGRVDASVAEARHAVARDPLSPMGRYFLAFQLFYAKQVETAIAEAHAVIELDPGFHHPYWFLGLALAALRRHDEAVESARRATTVAPADPLSQAVLGWTLGLVGHRQEALGVLEDLERRRTQEYLSGYMLAYVCLGLDQHEQAIPWLLTACEERDAMLRYLSIWPGWDPLRPDPRFQALLRRMNFPETAAEG